MPAARGFDLLVTDNARHVTSELIDLIPKQAE
jgi:hypothetical protein